MTSRQKRDQSRAAQKAIEAMRLERSAEERRLKALATKLRTAAARIDLAATYWGDGAYITAHGLLTEGRPTTTGRERSAASHVLQVARGLNGKRWIHAPPTKP